MELIENHVYRAKKPTQTSKGYVNDRMLLRVWENKVQFDSPTVRDGASYPSMPRTEFEAWAGEDVTNGYPDGNWARWMDRKKTQ